MWFSCISRSCCIFRTALALVASAILAACSGGGGVTPGAAPGGNGPSVGNNTGGDTASAPPSLYSITYLPLQSGCTSATVGGLASNGIAAVNQMCPTGDVSYLFDHGSITPLPFVANAVNAKKIVAINGTPGSLYNASTGQSPSLRVRAIR